MLQTGRPYTEFRNGSIEATGVTGAGTLPALRPVAFRQALGPAMPWPMVVCWVVCSVDGSIKLQLAGSLPRRSATHECALSCLIPMCSIAGREFAETTVIRPSLSMEQLR